MIILLFNKIFELIDLEMKNFTHKKLIKDLESFEDIDIAEEHVRAFPISIREKLHILETNRKLLTLRKAKTDYSPKYEIKKVKIYHKIPFSRKRFNKNKI